MHFLHTRYLTLRTLVKGNNRKLNLCGEGWNSIPETCNVGEIWKVSHDTGESVYDLKLCDERLLSTEQNTT
jgi:hypothetical protein